MDTTPEEAAQVVALLQQGLSQRAVAAQLHLSQSAVSRVYRRFQETGAFNRRPRTGRHRCTSERDDRFIVSTSLRNRHLTGVDVQQELRRVRQVAVSEWTVRRRLKEANLTPKRPASGPKLTAGHRQARLQFAREHLDWSIAQWRSVLFTDECRVCLHGSDRRGRVYRRPGERFAQCCFAETVAYGGGSCMMWAGISLEGKTALVFVPGGGRGGGLTADRYITDILLGHVVPYAEFVGEDFVLMHDNARCHTARVSRQFLREKELRTMDWPALSPDLNPIEHLWDELKRRVRARNPVPASVDELKTALLEEWDGIPQETVKKLIRSMRNRLQAVLSIIAIGLVVGTLNTPQVVQSDHRHIAVIFSAYSSFIIITGVLIIARLLGETPGWRTSLGFSILGVIMFTAACAVIFYDWHRSYYANMRPNKQAYDLLISSGVFAVINALVFLIHAFFTFIKEAEY
ncbi:unnamed protein product [Plutella xylostella]|uniref:(diamondback moth) hypothetical protein n=1 Tax=Plutella xylostella TaxID=51655 RepID=A0A8S4D794_PLUXY|nr:unnamed protein product [Plutella xylostella]